MILPNPFKCFSKPEYFLRPRQICRRLARIGKPLPAQATVRLPWGALVQVYTGENIGSAIYHHGIFDKVVPESIWRLLDMGECAVEVGANLGQNSSLMAFKAGRGGRVMAFEPHAEIFNELKCNHARSQSSDLALVQLENVALGENTGEAWLEEGDEFIRNRGSATLQNNVVGRKDGRVKVRRLDEFMDGVKLVGVCKIDVEGHELGVLRGAKETLARRGIRDIIFEDFNPQPSPVTTFLEQHGFALFELRDNWFKPQLKPLNFSPAASRPSFSFNYLATLDAARAAARFRFAGWHCLLNL